MSAIAVGAYHAVALKRDGSLVGWGLPAYNLMVPKEASSGVLSISAGQVHTLALKDDGSVLAWGHNDFGAISVPVGLTNVKAVAAGGYHSLALVGSAAPPLRIESTSWTVITSWPASAVGFQLQSTGSQHPWDWRPLVGVPELEEGWNKLIVRPDAATQLYRLVKP